MTMRVLWQPPGRGRRRRLLPRPVSADGGRTWQKKGALGAGPKELAAAPDGTLYAITGGGRIHRSTDAVKWSVVADLT